MDNRHTELILNLKTLARTSFVVFGAIIVSKALTYAYRIVLARHFGPESYGLFAIALMLLGWFITFSDFGMSQGLLRYIALFRGNEQKDRIRYTFKAALRVVLIPSLLFGAILFFFADFIAINLFHNPGLALFLKIFAPLVPINVYSYAFLSVLKGYEKIGWYSFIFNIAQNVVKVGTLLLFVLFGSHIFAIPISHAAGTLAVFIISWYLCKYKIREVFGKDKLSLAAKKETFKKLFAYSAPLLFFSIVSVIFYWIDTFFLGYLRGAAEVGLYNAAIPIAALFAFIPELFIQLFFPIISREYGKKNFWLMHELTKQVNKWIFAFNLPFFLLIFLFPGAAINVLFGADYLSAVTALRILSLGAFISSLFAIPNQLISAIGRTKLVLINIVVASAINVILNLVLIPMPSIWGINNDAGLVGAALSTTVAIVFMNLLVFLQARRYTDIMPFRRKMILMAFFALIPLGILLYIRQLVVLTLPMVVMLSVFFCLLYAGLTLLFNGLDRNDINVIKSILPKRFGFSTHPHNP